MACFSSSEMGLVGDSAAVCITASDCLNCATALKETGRLRNVECRNAMQIEQEMRGTREWTNWGEAREDGNEEKYS